MITILRGEMSVPRHPDRYKNVKIWHKFAVIEANSIQHRTRLDIDGVGTAMLEVLCNQTQSNPLLV